MGKEKSPCYYNDHLKHLFKKEYRWYDLYEGAAQLLPPPSENTIVDLGCGVGGFARLLYRKGYERFLGIDFSSYGIEICRKRVPSFAFIVGNLLDARIRERFSKHSTFVILEVLEHINRDIKLITSIPSKSTVIFSVPNKDFESHVRFFNNPREVKSRYKGLLRFVDGFEVDKREKPGQKMFLFKTVRSTLNG